MLSAKIGISSLALEGKLERDGDWGRLNASFHNDTVSPYALAEKIYEGHPFTAWMKSGWRSQENFECGQAVAVDLDAASFDAVRANRFYQRFPGILYQTPSHTDEQPRTRVVHFLSREIDTPAGFELLSRMIYKMYPGSDESCAEPGRFFYGNGRLKAEGNVGGIDLPSTLKPVDVRYMRALLKTSPQMAALMQPKTGPDTETDFRNPTAPAYGERRKPTLEQITNALLPTDSYELEYGTWVSVVAALKAEYGDDAFQLAEEWSWHPTKKPLTWERWQSFQDRVNRPSGIGTIMYVLDNYYGARVYGT